jgi:hypothetical protein
VAGFASRDEVAVARRQTHTQEEPEEDDPFHT